MASEKQVVLSIAEDSIVAGQELHGKVHINYLGRFDSLVINSQIDNSNDVFSYTFLNGKKINHPYARLSVFKTELGGKNPVEFTATTKHVPASDNSSVKFRVSLIQEHKEIFNDVRFVQVVKA